MQWLERPRQLSIPPAAGFAALLRVCRADAKATELIRIADPKQLMLHPKYGRTLDGFRFNTPAFQQVCSDLAGSSFSVLRFLFQDGRGPEKERSELVQKIYNQMVHLVGKNLTGHRLVVDRENKMIVGVVGRTYKFVSNAELLSTVSSYLQGTESKYRMVEARLSNRDLFVLCLRKTSPITIGDIQLREGVAIYNSETTRNAIFLPRVLFDSKSKSYSMESETEENRLIHRKKKKFNQALDSVAKFGFSSDGLLSEVAPKCKQMLVSELGKPEDNAVLLKKISAKLLAKDFRAAPVLRVASLLQGKDAITRWRFYTALVTAAKDFSSSERQLRTAAFTYLMRGEIK